MSRKTKREKQRARRALDYRATMSLHGDALQVAPYVDQAAAIEKRVATPTQGANGEVTVYDVTCLAELPTSMTGSARGVTTRFDISSSEYPLASPTAMVVSSAKPFCTHVSPDSGGVCLGGLWRTLQGKELLAELVLRVFQAFNHQDPNTSEPGYQPHARALRERLNGRPFNPKFVLPAVPDDVFHDDGPRVVRARVTIVGMPARASGSRVQLPSSVRPRIRIVSGGGL